MFSERLGNIKLLVCDHSDLQNSFLWFYLIFSTTDDIPVYADGLGERVVYWDNNRISLGWSTVFL